MPPYLVESKFYTRFLEKMLFGTLRCLIEGKWLKRYLCASIVSENLGKKYPQIDILDKLEKRRSSAIFVDHP